MLACVNAKVAANLDLQDSLLVVPDIFFGEVANGLRKLVARKKLQPDEAVYFFERMDELRFEVIATYHLVGDALRAAMHFNASAFDCLYLAIAEEQGHILVTADARFYQALRQHHYVGPCRLVTGNEDP